MYYFNTFSCFCVDSIAFRLHSFLSFLFLSFFCLFLRVIALKIGRAGCWYWCRELSFMLWIALACTHLYQGSFAGVCLCWLLFLDCFTPCRRFNNVSDANAFDEPFFSALNRFCHLTFSHSVWLHIFQVRMQYNVGICTTKYSPINHTTFFCLS